MLVDTWIKEIEEEKKQKKRQEDEQRKEQSRYQNMMRPSNMKSSMPKMPKMR